MDRRARAAPGPSTARRRLAGPGVHCSPAEAHVGPDPGPGGPRRRGRQVRTRPAAPPRARAPEATGRAGEGSPRSWGLGSEAAAPRTGGAAGTEGGGAGAAGGRMGPRGRSRRTPLTVPPSLMMIFLASMILRFEARFFFFPWVILPSSSPGPAAATPGAAGPRGECRPATTTGPSRSGCPPPSSGPGLPRAARHIVRSATSRPATPRDAAAPPRDTARSPRDAGRPAPSAEKPRRGREAAGVGSAGREGALSPPTAGRPALKLPWASGGGSVPVPGAARPVSVKHLLSGGRTGFVARAPLFPGPEGSS